MSRAFSPLYDVVTFGETMLRLSPPGEMRLEQAHQLNMHFGGAESNVAINLARLGARTAWFSRLPDTPLGRSCTTFLQGHGVDVSAVQWAQDERIGLYFVEFGQPPRSTQVWYDRAGSAASRMTPADLPFALIEQSRWLHITGITPALSADCAQTVAQAVAYARRQRITISCDVNYRALLWSADDAAAALEPLCQQADIVLVARRDAALLWHQKGSAGHVAEALHQRWGGTIIVTAGEHGASACDHAGLIEAPVYPTTIVDRIGAGDAFASGVIFMLLEGGALSDALRFGTATAALKLSIAGDIALVTRAEVEALVNGQQRALLR